MSGSTVILLAGEGVAAVEVVAPSGGLTLDAATPNVSVNVTAPPGDLTLDGVLPALVITITAPSGDASLDAGEAILGVNISAPVGILVLDAVAPAMAGGVNVEAPVGELTLDAVIPVVSTGGTVSIDAPPGDLILDGIGPVAPARWADIVLVRAPHPRLGGCYHEITSDNGSFCFRPTESWEAIEIANGGYWSATDVVSEQVARRHRHVFARDADWVTYHEQTGDVIWAGRLREDVLQKGNPELTGDGDGRRAEKRTGHIIYQSRDLGDWHSHPRVTDDLKWSVDTSGAALKFRRTEVASQANNVQYSASAVFYSESFYPLRRIAFTMRFASFDATAKARLSVVAGNPALEVTLLIAEYTLPDAISGSSLAVDLSVITPSGQTNQIALWGADTLTGTENAKGCRIDISDLRVNGVSATDEFSVSAVVRDLCARMGASDIDVDEFSFNALPYELEPTASYAEALDYMALLANARWLVLRSNNRRYIDFARFDKRSWQVADSHSPVEMIHLPRYDRVTVGYRVIGGDWSDQDYGRQRGSVTVEAEEKLETSRPYHRVSLGNALKSPERARAVGQRLVDELVQNRWSGDATLSDVLDEDGRRQSAYRVHAGDLLTEPPRRMRLAQVTKTISGVRAEGEDEYLPVDRLKARKAKRMERV